MSEEVAINLVLFSGTDDKLQAAAVLAAGAAALGKPVTFSFSTGRSTRFEPIGSTRICPSRQRPALKARRPWNACAARVSSHGRRPSATPRTSARSISRPARLSMDILGLSSDQLDPLVDGVEGVASFYVNAGDGQVVFI